MFVGRGGHDLESFAFWVLKKGIYNISSKLIEHIGARPGLQKPIAYSLRSAAAFAEHAMTLPETSESQAERLSMKGSELRMVRAMILYS